MHDDGNQPEDLIPIDQITEHETIVATENALLPYVLRALRQDKKMLAMSGLKIFHLYSERIDEAIRHCEDDIRKNREERSHLFMHVIVHDWLHHELIIRGYIFHIHIRKNQAIEWINEKAKEYLHK